MADNPGFDKNLPTVTTNPDPTDAVREALTLAVKNLTDSVDQQFASNDKAVVLARDELAAQLAAMMMTIDGKFAANKDLVDQLAKANATALSAALQTQKESAAKSEVSTGDLIKQSKVSQDEANRVTNEKIDRLTSRRDMDEGRDLRDDRHKQENAIDRSQSISIGQGLIALAGVLIALAVFVAARTN
jgi:hypothetical protein